jgi:glycosyltransferase involved in cell wall biosynthesis
MYRPEEIAAVIPCLNEGRSIGPLVREVRGHLPHVIVVNDGSTDLTAAEAKNAGALVLHHRFPKGKGASLRAGFAAALERRFTWALAMDGDGQHAPADIPGFLRAAENSPRALLIGNRMTNTFSMPLVRRLVNQWMSRSISTFMNFQVPDSQCGFRMVHLPTWNRLHFSSEHFEIESEMIVRFLHAGHSIDFVPVETRYASETSKIRPLRDTLRWFRWWSAIRNEFSADANCSPARQTGYESTPQDATA